MENKLPDDLQSIADKLVSAADEIRRAADNLASIANKIREAEDHKRKNALVATDTQATPQLSEDGKPKKSRKPPCCSADRKDKIKKAVKLFWKKKLLNEKVDGKKVTRRWAATECGLEVTALSKRGSIADEEKTFCDVMKEDIPKAIEDAKAFKGIRKIDRRTIRVLLNEIDKVLDKFLK